jgi:hypothetical protein
MQSPVNLISYYTVRNLWGELDVAPSSCQDDLGEGRVFDKNSHLRFNLAITASAIPQGHPTLIAATTLVFPETFLIKLGIVAAGGLIRAEPLKKRIKSHFSDSGDTVTRDLKKEDTALHIGGHDIIIKKLP